MPRLRSSRRAVAAALAILAGSAAVFDAAAAPLDVVNRLRRQDCGAAVAPAALAPAPLLDAAAQRVAEGATLRAAVDGSGYRALSSTLIAVDVARNDPELARLVAQSCARIVLPALRDAGIYQRGRAVWIVLAEPFTAPALDRAAVRARILDLVNATRAQARRCGAHDFAAALPLRWSPVLERAASGHAREMAERSAMSHSGRDGSTPSQRVTRAGYAWTAVGENIAAGQRDADGVVRSWIASPGHCANLMSPDFTEVGVAFATDSASEAGIYWVQVFAAPLAPAPRTSQFGRR
jgi:uncharacterized protein YkwD